MSPNATQLSDGQDCLTGQLLVAMPSLGEGCFHKSVILICGHDDHHAMGLIVNKRVTDLTFSEIMAQLDFEVEDDDMPPFAEAVIDENVHYGGPVEPMRGLVLHTLDQTYEETVNISGEVGLTATKEIVADIARAKKAPKNALLCMGHAGWEAGQLEDELVQNAWLTMPADLNLIFTTPIQKCWAAALASIGIDPSMLAADTSNPRDPDAPLN
ncbi:MAG: YqgE/AlgH family protein [Parvularculaceae bacterium]